MLMIQVWASSSGDSKLELHYDPPPSAWKFRQTYPLVDMGVALEKEIADVASTFVGEVSNPLNTKSLTLAVRNVLHRWQNNGWLELETGYQRL